MKDRALSRIIKILFKHKFILIFAILSSIIQVVATLFIPIVVRNGIDYLAGINDVNFNYLNNVLIYVAILGILQALFGYLMQYLMAYITNNTVKDLRNTLFKKLDKLPLSYIDTIPEGDTLMRLTSDADQLGDGLLQALTNLIIKLNLESQCSHILFCVFSSPQKEHLFACTT